MVDSCRETGLPVFPLSTASLEVEEETLPSLSLPLPLPFLEKTVPFGHETHECYWKGNAIEI